MSREIKFRIWNKGNNTMINPYKITPFAINENLKQDGLFLPFSDQFMLMQYTGLKDKNGVEIYEGDIVKQDEPMDGNFISAKIDWFEVRWQGTGFTFAPIKDRNIKQYTVRPFSNYIEVIGNIYENPELLQP